MCTELSALQFLGLRQSNILLYVVFPSTDSLLNYPGSVGYKFGDY